MRKPTRAGIRRLALVALFALATQALLPFVHALGAGCDPLGHACAAPHAGASTPSSDGGPSHPADCAVCGALAHAGARVLDAPGSVAAVSAPLTAARLVIAPFVFASSVDADTASARAPPVSLRLA